MKPSKATLEALSDMQEVTTSGDLRRIVGNSLLALARKEISATDLEAMAKGLDSISNSVNAEIKVAKLKVDIRDFGQDIGNLTHLGNMVIRDSLEPPKDA